MAKLTFGLHGDGVPGGPDGVDGPAGVLPVGVDPHPGHGQHGLEQVLRLLADVRVVVQHTRLCNRGILVHSLTKGILPNNSFIILKNTAKIPKCLRNGHEENFFGKQYERF